MDDSRLQALERREWLETDEIGGFAMGTGAGLRTRRYHAISTVATRPPTGRVTMVHGIEAWIETPQARSPLSTHRYAGDVLHPRGIDLLERFELAPWPTWTYRLPNGARLVHEMLIDAASGDAILRWHLPTLPWCRLEVRPLLGPRDYHALHRENDAFRFDVAAQQGSNVVWRPYAGLPAIAALSNGAYEHAPDWFRGFDYAEERARGLDHVEDLASPGVFRWARSASDLDGMRVATLVFRTGDGVYLDAASYAEGAATRERDRRRALGGGLERAADAYLVRRGDGHTVIAGYPWFTDWGRDTFIAIRGLGLANGRIADTKRVLLRWADEVSEGMLPNRFPDDGGTAEFNSVDASLWFVVATSELFAACGGSAGVLAPSERDALSAAVRRIVEAYARGTRFGIHADEDGLLAAGVPGAQLTWMDAKVGDWVVTPRIGKPVEVQALWVNALAFAERFDAKWRDLRERACRSFEARFWDEGRGCLLDVVDVDHAPGRVDASFRPNQIFAVGGLPVSLLEGPRARRVVDAVERRLLTPVGLRSLAPDDPRYLGSYVGGVRERDGAYHEGTVWPWLLGAFVDAWLRVRGRSEEARAEARARFLAPLEAHLEEAGLGHVSEIADGDAPHRPCGAPFQAWSLGELLRIRAWLGAGQEVE